MGPGTSRGNLISTAEREPFASTSGPSLPRPSSGSGTWMVSCDAPQPRVLEGADGGEPQRILGQQVQAAGVDVRGVGGRGLALGVLPGRPP